MARRGIRRCEAGGSRGNLFLTASQQSEARLRDVVITAIEGVDEACLPDSYSQSPDIISKAETIAAVRAALMGDGAKPAEGK